MTKLGVSFQYDRTWGTPNVIGAAQGGSWRLDLGPVCDNCAEGDDVATYQIFGLSAAQAEIQLGHVRDAIAEDSTEIIRDTTRSDGLRLVEFTEGGMCGYRSVLLITETRAVRVTGFCLGDDPAAWRALTPLIDSLKITSDRQQELAFDSCGSPSQYADESWYDRFIAKAEATSPLRVFKKEYGEQWRGAESFIPEMCASLDGTTVIAAWNGGYCQGTGLLRYDIASNSLQEAVERGEIGESQCYSIGEFGKRRGNIVPLTGDWADAGCRSTFNYEYDLSENELRLISSCGSCAPKPVECQSYE